MNPCAGYRCPRCQIRLVEGVDYCPACGLKFNLAAGLVAYLALRIRAAQAAF